MTKERLSRDDLVRLTLAGARMNKIVSFQPNYDNGTRREGWEAVYKHLVHEHPEVISPNGRRILNYKGQLGDMAPEVAMKYGIARGSGNGVEIRFNSRKTAEEYAEQVLGNTGQLTIEDVRKLGKVFIDGLEGKMPEYLGEKAA